MTEYGIVRSKGPIDLPSCIAELRPEGAIHLLWGQEHTLRQWLGFQRDNGLRLALSLAADDLDALEDYFDQRMDADGDSEGYRPNEEMRLFQAVQRVKELHRRIAESKPPQTHAAYLMGKP